MNRLQRAPFHLSDTGVGWVEETLGRMSVEEKIGQVFCLVSYRADEEALRYMAEVLKAGGVMCRRGPAADVASTVGILQEKSAVPLLIASNLEAGGDGLVEEGTRIGSQMAIAATGDVDMAYRLGLVCGREASAVGGNWAFAPVVDIDFNFRNPITNTRTFGSDPQRVADMARACIRGLQENGVAATVKHFPGDGADERDQHLVTTVNSLDCDEWDRTYGMVFTSCIDAGVLAVMVGHIALPAYSKRLRPGIKDEEVLPASLAYEIATILLREKLGFNGLVVSDATAMAGMDIAMGRPRAVPGAIAAGCDVFLFTRDLEEDFRFMKEGLTNGVLTEERLTEAARNVLALKAALRLHEKHVAKRSSPVLAAVPAPPSEPAAAGDLLGCAPHRAWARECADRAITLVKEETGVLPLSPEKTPRLLLYAIQDPGETWEGAAGGDLAGRVRPLLEREGFTVDVFAAPRGLEGAMASYEETVAAHDLMLYLADLGTRSNQTTVRIGWTPPMGADVPIYLTAVPTVFVSLANPYHLLDVPRVRTYVNAYDSSDVVLEMLVDKLMGRSRFQGVSPVDPFCGKWDTRL